MTIERTFQKRGKVKWFSLERGYGFISPENKGEREVWVDVSALKSAGVYHLEENQAVSYELRKNIRQNKDYAENVQLLNGVTF